MANKLFLDTSYVIALAVPRDEHHAQALNIRAQIQSQNTSFDYNVSGCLGNRKRPVWTKISHSGINDKMIEIVPVAEELYRDGLQLYKDRIDKDWSLTDCISFLVMQDRRLTDALTTDRHFEQAGFRALLRGM